jgi:hypothetical protein
MIDNNLYWNSSSGRPFYQGGLAWDWISWTRTLGHDTHGAGPNTNPRFINSGRSYSKDLDFALQSTSPAINKGANVGLSTDYTGNPISGIPDIGAYEYQPVASVNAAPVVVVASPKSSYSGFVNEINASGSYDTNNDSLSYEWIVPGDIAVSSTNDPKIQFLGPIVNKSQTVEFTLKVSNGKTTQLKTIPIEILPYKPELEVAEISNIEASSFQAPYYPYNIIDGNIGTMWSANGDNQWLIIELKQSFSVQHVKLAFQLGQREESYFDILGSEDKVNWEPILTKSASCAFSGGIQVFNFPPSKAGKEYKYIKLVGHSNSGDSWNYISEFKIFGYKHRKPSSYEEQPVKIYPNPAHDYINIRIDEPTLVTDFIRICNLSGKAVFQHEINPDIREYQFPINLHNGIYILQLLSHNLIQFTQKLVIAFK